MDDSSAIIIIAVAIGISIIGIPPPVPPPSHQIFILNRIDLFSSCRANIKINREERASTIKRQQHTVGERHPTVESSRVLREGEQPATPDRDGEQDCGCLGVASCATERDGEDDAESAAFEEVDHQAHGDGRGTGCFHAEDCENDHADVGKEEDPAGFEEKLGEGCEEAADGKRSVAQG